MATERNEKELQKEIEKIKKERRALILAHNYQLPEIQVIGDLLGDSLDLSRAGAESDAEIIVFCGVYFMAESVKILAPDKTVLLPRIDAGCPLADMATPEGILKMKEQHPDAAVVTYINSSAAVKAVSDICCTSANAAKVANSMPQDEIIFAPDRNLASWVTGQTDKKIYPWNGFCPTHDRLRVEDIKEAKKNSPEGTVAIAHPECRAEVLEEVDYITGTSGMVRLAKELDTKDFIIATEIGLVERLRRENPEKRFYPASEKMLCKNMKKTNLESVRDALLDIHPEVEVLESVRTKALKALKRMLEV